MSHKKTQHMPSNEHYTTSGTIQKTECPTCHAVRTHCSTRPDLPLLATFQDPAGITRINLGWTEICEKGCELNPSTPCTTVWTDNLNKQIPPGQLLKLNPTLLIPLSSPAKPSLFRSLARMALTGRWTTKRK